MKSSRPHQLQTYFGVLLILALLLGGCAPPSPTLAPTAAAPEATQPPPPTAAPAATATAVPTEPPTAAPTEVKPAHPEEPQSTPVAMEPGGGHGGGMVVEPEDLLDPLSIPKFVSPLVIPPVMPAEGEKDWNGQGEVATEYHIAVRQFKSQILPEGFPATTVWGYGHAGDPLPGEGKPTTFNSPAFTVEARSNELVRVVWYNHLVDDPEAAEPKFLPHLLPVDQTLHWANPAGGGEMHAMGDAPYNGPVPIISHVHGAHVPAISDGYPEAWFLPPASDIPAGFSPQGPNYDSVHPAPAGAAVFEYPNSQRASTIWYHDHAMGITRLNVYAGMAGFWLIRDDEEDALNLPGPAPRLGDEPETRYYEIPIAIQDRSFNQDGSLFYPHSRKFFDAYEGPYMPQTDVSPIWNPEFFGNTIMVNGKTWPYLEVEPRLYRLRLLNGAQSRFLLLKFDQELVFHQIGNEGGLLPNQPLEQDQLLLAPAERADVIVDFSKFKPGDELTLLNLGPDSPFGSLPIEPEDRANPETTGQVMQFRVIEKTDQGNPGQIPTKLPAIDQLTTDLPPRDLTLNEAMSMGADIPVEALLGTGADGPLDFAAPITEKPVLDSTEIWRIINLTADAHPVHLHLVHFQVLDRTPFDKEAYMEAQVKYLQGGKQGEPPDPFDFATGDSIPAEAWEAGWKETVIASPDMITRLITNFDMLGLYVWHCHILEHEDNEMMRPYEVVPE